jgi:ABC-type Mn2+/Zn2+ transport system permease subunit
MLIIPPTTALYLSARLPVVALLSGVIGGACGGAGATISYVFEGVATGPAMVLIAAAAFGLATVFGPRGGRVWTWLRRERRTSSAEVPA